VLSLLYSLLKRNHSGDSWIKDHIHKCVTLNEIHADYYVSSQPQSHGTLCLEVSFACWNLFMLHPLLVRCGKEGEGKNNPDIFLSQILTRRDAWERTTLYLLERWICKPKFQLQIFLSKPIYGKKIIIITSQQAIELLLQFIRGLMRPAVRIWIKHARYSLQGHTVKNVNVWGKSVLSLFTHE